MNNDFYDISGIKPLERAIAEDDPHGTLMRLTGIILKRWQEKGCPSTMISDYQNKQDPLPGQNENAERRGLSFSTATALRFNFILGGEYRIIHDIKNRAMDDVIRPGGFFWGHPNSWHLVRNDASRTVFGVVFRQEHTRFLWYHHKCERASDIHSSDDVHTILSYHTHAPASAVLRHAVALMDEVAASVSEECIGERNTGSNNNALLHSTCQALLAACLRELHVDAKLAEAAKLARASAIGKRSFDEICAWINEHVQSNLDRKRVACLFRISEDHLTRLFRTHAQCGYIEYVRAERFRLAERLLVNSRLSIKEVADACGFNLTAYFIKRFREQHGVTPASWRRRSPDNAKKQSQDPGENEGASV